MTENKQKGNCFFCGSIVELPINYTPMFKREIVCKACEEKYEGI